MVLSVTADLVLARLLLENVPGERIGVITHGSKDDEEDWDKKTTRRRKGMSATEIKADEAQQQLRRRIYEEQPDIILLDVQFGGSSFRVIDSVPRILEETKSKPKVILIVPFQSDAAEEEAARLGCFDVLIYSSRRRQVFLRELLETLTAAELDRKRDGEVPPAATSSGVIH